MLISADDSQRPFLEVPAPARAEKVWIMWFRLDSSQMDR